jgi:hypothetical protein
MKRDPYKDGVSTIPNAGPVMEEGKTREINPKVVIG